MSSLQLRAISNFGTLSATATINCEFKIIIEIEIGIYRLLFVLTRPHRQKVFIQSVGWAKDRLAPCPIERTTRVGAPLGPPCSASLRFVAAFLAAGFEQEPGAALGLVDEGLEQPGGTGILVIVGKLVGLAHRGSDVLVVFHQLAKHFARRHVALVVVLDGLQFSDLPDRAHRGAAELANALGQLIGGGENRVGLLVEHQMIVAEMPAADVPMKILGLQ